MFQNYSEVHLKPNAQTPTPNNFCHWSFARLTPRVKRLTVVTTPWLSSGQARVTMREAMFSALWWAPEGTTAFGARRQLLASSHHLLTQWRSQTRSQCKQANVKITKLQWGQPLQLGSIVKKKNTSGFVYIFFFVFWFFFFVGVAFGNKLTIYSPIMLFDVVTEQEYSIIFFLFGWTIETTIKQMNQIFTKIKSLVRTHFWFIKLWEQPVVWQMMKNQKNAQKKIPKMFLKMTNKKWFYTFSISILYS